MKEEWETHVVGGIVGENRTRRTRTCKTRIWDTRIWDTRTGHGRWWYFLILRRFLRKVHLRRGRRELVHWTTWFPAGEEEDEQSDKTKHHYTSHNTCT